MATFYGEETVNSYESQGGIALMSNDYPPGTVSGSGTDPEEGGVAVPARIRWVISFDGIDYTGGITNNGFYLEEINAYDTTTGQPIILHSPFYGRTAAELYAIARDEGNLNSVFERWNATYSNEVHSFVNYISSMAPSCVNRGTVGG